MVDKKIISEAGRFKHTLADVYPGMKDLDRLLESNDVSISSVTNLYNKVMAGLEAQKMIAIEEQWLYAVNAYKEYIADKEVKDDDTANLLLNDVVAIETRYPWLNTLRTTGKYTRPKPYIRPMGDVYKKKLITKLRDNNVRTLEDSVADVAKTTSLLFSMVAAIYSTLTEEQKASLDPKFRSLSEYTINKFTNTQTRADTQLETEGAALIDKLLFRETSIDKIITDVKSLR